MPKTIRVAKYDGRCGWCGEWVKAGEEVKKKHGTIGHPACAKKHQKDERY